MHALPYYYTIGDEHKNIVMIIRGLIVNSKIHVYNYNV